MATSSSSASSSEKIPRPLYTFGIPWPELNDGVNYTDIIKSVDSGKTLIDFYSSKYKNSAPLQGWIQRIKNGQISVDGDMVTDPNAILRVGCEVVYCRLPWIEPDVPYLLEVLYEDEDMVAINKPSGLQVLPGGLFQQRTVLRQLQWKVCGQNLCYPSKSTAEELHPAPVHRLGRGTSGILLCAKTKQTKICLAGYFAKGTTAVGNNSTRFFEFEDRKTRKISKFYRALVTGLLEKDEIIINQPIGVMHYPEVATGLYVASPSGRPALSKVRVLERDIEASQTRVE